MRLWPSARWRTCSARPSARPDRTENRLRSVGMVGKSKNGSVFGSGEYEAYLEHNQIGGRCCDADSGGKVGDRLRIKNMASTEDQTACSRPVFCVRSARPAWQTAGTLFCKNRRRNAACVQKNRISADFRGIFSLFSIYCFTILAR